MSNKYLSKIGRLLLILLTAFIVVIIIYYFFKKPSSIFKPTVPNNPKIDNPISTTTPKVNPELIKKNPCEQNKFTAAFLLISPNPSDQKTKEYLDFFKTLKTDFEQSFQEATYNLADLKVDDFFVTKIGSEKYLDEPGSINEKGAISDLIAHNGDKYDFVLIFTTYDTKMTANYFTTVKNTTKNIGLEIVDNSKDYGSSGHLLGYGLFSDYMETSKKFTNSPEYKFTHLPDDQPPEVVNLLHEIGHNWCCYLGQVFTGNNNSKLAINIDWAHFYGGLEAPTRTREVMGALPWAPDKSNDNYSLEKTVSDFAYLHYPIRYHPIQLYLMGLLPRDQYSTEFNIINMGTTNGNMSDNNNKKYNTISVNDIIKLRSERTCARQD